ncbi:MAG: hypothetical protein HY646_18860 [Acidobacteria bacterium]|nr:hypothetical protein [Acidobacteriota bacterium]
MKSTRLRSEGAGQAPWRITSRPVMVWTISSSGSAEPRTPNLLLYNWIVTGVSIRENSGSRASADSIDRGNLSTNGNSDVG